MNYVHDKASITGPDDYVIRYFYRPEGPRYVAIRGVGPGGFTTVHHYDPVQRPIVMGNDLPGAVNDMTVTLGYNPAGQIRQYSRDNDAYAWTGGVAVTRNYAANGLNQYVGTSTGAEFAYDPNGNLVSVRKGAASTDYVYDVENRLVSASGEGGRRDPGFAAIAHLPARPGPRCGRGRRLVSRRDGRISAREDFWICAISVSPRRRPFCSAPPPRPPSPRPAIRATPLRRRPPASRASAISGSISPPWTGR
jgi:YD repeat-containing protein